MTVAPTSARAARRWHGGHLDRPPPNTGTDCRDSDPRGAMIEELSKVCATSGLIIAVQELGSLGIKLAGGEEQKARFLPRLASGEWLAAYALTEPGSGSDSAAMRTTARREDGEDVLNGGKRFIK